MKTANQTSLGKKLLNTLWGALGQKNEINLIYFDDKVETMSDNSVLTSITFLRTESKQKSGKYKVKFYKSGKRYATNYARIFPFLLVRGRVKISKTLELHRWILEYKKNRRNQTRNKNR